MENVIISGDPGLLPDPIRRQSPLKNESKIVAINWGTAHNRLYGSNEEKLEKDMVQSIKKLIAKGYKIRIYPIWSEDKRPCKRLYKAIADTENVECITRLSNQHEIMDLIKDCTFTINFKLHANVLSAVSGIPFIALGYRFKTFDFANSIGLDSLVVSTDDAHFQQSILTAANNIECNGTSLMRNIEFFQIECENQLEKIYLSFRKIYHEHFIILL